MPGGGSKPGERRGGRGAGTPNKSTAEIKALAQVHGPAAIARLALLSGLTDQPGSDSEATQLGAMKELLDRGYGRATQPISGSPDDEMPQLSMKVRFVRS
jgi:hypothetical protein